MKSKYFDLAAYISIAIFVIFFVLLSFGRHDGLKSYLNDLGTYDQAIWNTAHGNFFALTCSMIGIPNYLGGHFSPILVFFVPFYWIFASPKWLLFFQALAVGLGGLPIYWLAREKLKKSFIALLFLIGYLFYPFLQNGVLYDFHEVVLAVFFASFAFYFLEKNKDKLFILFASLLALSQEHLALLVFMMGLYLIFAKKRWKFGLCTAIVSMAYFFLVMAFLMPHFSSTGVSAILSNESAYPSRYAWLGSSVSEIVRNMVFHPVEVIKVLFSFERMNYLFLLIIPTFSLALFSWPIAIILPILAINLLSSNGMTYNVFFYHSAIVAPFVFFVAVFSFKKWFLGVSKMETAFLALFLVSAVFAGFILGVSPLSNKYTLADYIPDKHARLMAEIKKIIPADAEISIQHNLGSHFSGREKIYRFPIKYQEAEYVFVDTTDPYRNNPQQIFQFEYALQMDMKEWEDKIAEMKASANYALIYDQDGYLLFKKNK